MDRLEAMRVLAAVNDAGSFRAGARRLGRTPSAVTRLIAGLEAALGVHLLHRTTRSLHLTDTGSDHLQRVRRILSDVEEAEAMARGELAAPRGRFVIAAPVIFGRLHVAPLLAGFMTQHAQVSGELMLDDRNVGLVEEGVDLAMRIGALEDSSLIAKRLGLTRRVVVASPDYLARRGQPQEPAGLAAGGHDLILFAAAQSGREWVFESSDGPIRVTLAPRLVTHGGDVAIAYARDGGGIARALLYQLQAAVRAGELSILFQCFEPRPWPIHAVYASSRLLSAKVRGFIDLAVDSTDWHFT